MRIALASSVPVLGHGGVEVLVRELAAGLSDEHTVFVASPDDPARISASGLAGCVADHHPLPVGNRAVVDTCTLIQWLRDRRADLCHFHSGGTYAWKAGAPGGGVIPKVAALGLRCFNTNHQAVSPFDANRKGDPLHRRVGFFVRTFPGKCRQLASVEREILVSRHDERLSRRCFPLHRRNMMTIYHSRLPAESAGSDLPHSKIILNLATVCFRKGQHVLVEAFARVAGAFPGWRLRLVGRIAESACADEILGIARRHGLEDRIELAGASDHPKDEIRDCEVYVQPSLLEGLGLSLQEALWEGRPCLGTRVGGIPELIDDGSSGELVRAGEPGEMAAALSRYLGDRGLRERTGAAAAGSLEAKQMTRQAMLEAYLSLYQ